MRHKTLIRRQFGIIFLGTLGLFLGSELVGQQFGGIRGQVVDSDFGQPIGKASVVVMDTVLGAMTDDQGNFTISGIPPGIYTLQVRASGYLPRIVPEAAVAAGSFNDLRVEVVAEIEEMEELVVPGELDKASEVGLLTERQEATAVMDMIGQDFIARLGAATAGDALKRVTGTSVVDGKYVSVRGLSDRYVNTLLNGGRLPSTDPDKRAVNVDLFPGASLESINVIKTFTPDQPGDFTGGSVDLRTRNFPDKPSFGASATVEYNSQATFNPNFLSYQGGGTGPFGFQADKRMIPESVTSSKDFLNDPEDLSYPDDLQQADEDNTLMRNMNPVLSLRPKTVGPNYKMNLQGGDVVDFGDDQKMGVFGLFSYNREYTYYGNGTRTQFYREQTPGGSETNVISGYAQQRGTEDVLWGTLLNFSGQLSANHKVSSNFIFNEQASDNATASQMVVAPAIDTKRTSATVIDYGERQLAFMQLTGESIFPEAIHLKMNWNGGLGRAQLTEPDQRAFQAVTESDGTQRAVSPSLDVAGYALYGNPSPAFRYQRELTENSFYTIADFLVPMDGEEQYDNAFKTGFYYDQTSRSYNQDSYYYIYGGSNDPYYETSKPNIPGQTWSDYFLSPERSGLVNPTGQGNKQLMSWTPFDSAEFDGTFYDASQSITASYLMANFNLFPQLKLTGGARFENTNIQIKGADNLPGSLFPGFTGLAKIQQLDLLPAVAATFELAKDVNLRFSWSQTLARPSFKEMGPVLTQDFGDSTYFVGNPFLQLSSINNYDFRAEWFPRAGEVISLGLFYKEIDAPIEQITFGSPNSGTYLKYDNSDRGQLWGWEVEFRKRLDQVHAVLKDFSVFFNFTQIQSQVTLSEEEIEDRNDAGIPGDTRPLQGQPAYVLNTGLNYDKEEYRFYAGVYFNVSGEFLYAAGGGINADDILPDVYEQPFPSLDFNITQGLTDNWKMTFRGKNMLNPFYRLTQTIRGVEIDTYTYTKGWDLSLNVSYSF